MKKNASYVSEANGRMGIIALGMFLMFIGSAFGSGWLSFGAVAGTSDIEIMGDPGPDPTGGPGSGWIADQLVDTAGADTREPAIATGPGGVLHAVYAVNAAVGGWNIIHRSSNDGGITWSITGGVAASPDNERNPDIVVHPGDGRIFVAYEREVAVGDTDIWVSYSDDGTTWVTTAVVTYVGSEEVNPSIVVEHDFMPNYFVWVSFEAIIDTNNRNIFVYRSPDRGATWNLQLARGYAPDNDVYSDPDIAFHLCTDGFDRLYVAYRHGVDATDIYRIDLEWSENLGATWTGPINLATEANTVMYPSMAAARNGDSVMVVWQEMFPTDIRLRYVYDTDPNTPAAGWLGPLTRGDTGTNGIGDYAPKLAADGEGTDSNAIGGNYTLIWTTGLNAVNVTQIRTDIVGGWAPFSSANDDPPRMASVSYPIKGLAKQQRGSEWFPVMVWADFRGTYYDTMFTTPGSRVLVDTSPTALQVSVDFVVHTAPVAFDWPAGWNHLLLGVTPQAGGPGIQYVFNSWSDGGPLGHLVPANTTDMTYICYFDAQAELTIEAYDTVTASALNVQLWVNGVPTANPTPWTDWYTVGQTYNFEVEDPYNDGVDDYNFVDWSTGSTNNPLPHLITVPETLTANYAQVPTNYYAFEVTPSTLTVAPGDIATYTVTFTSVNGYTGDVWLTASSPGLIPPASPTFTPNPVTVNAAGGTSTLNIDTTGATDGIYTVTVDGDDLLGTLWTNTTELIIATPTFDVSALPPTQMIANSPGQQAVIDVTVTSVNGFSGNVDLDIFSVVPAGFVPPATYAFVPAQVTVPMGGSATSTLTITNAAGVPDDTYTVTIRGDDGAETDDFSVDVEVTTIAFFTIDATALQSVTPGGVATYTVTVTSMNNYVGNVDISVSHALTIADASFSWDNTALAIPDGGSDQAVLTVDTTPTIAVQDHLLDFYADDGALNETDQSTLNVTAVVSGSISGVVTDQDGDPIEDAVVELLDGTNLVDDTTTNSDGEYSFGNVDAGTYTVKATKDGYDEDTITVTVTAGDPDQVDKDLQLELLTYEIEGDLKDGDTGEGIGGATVEIYDENDDLVGSDTTSGNGHFSIDDLLPGTYTIVITADGYKKRTLEEEITDEDIDLGDVELSAEAEPINLADYWWLLLLIIIIIVVVILIALLAKRKKPAPEEAPPQYAEAQVPPEQVAPYEAPPEQQPYQPPPETYPEEPQPGMPPEEAGPESPPEGYPPE